MEILPQRVQCLGGCGRFIRLKHRKGMRLVQKNGYCRKCTRIRERKKAKGQELS